MGVGYQGVRVLRVGGVDVGVGVRYQEIRVRVGV